MLPQIKHTHINQERIKESVLEIELHCININTNSTPRNTFLQKLRVNNEFLHDVLLLAYFLKEFLEVHPTQNYFKASKLVGSIYEEETKSEN